VRRPEQRRRYAASDRCHGVTATLGWLRSIWPRPDALRVTIPDRLSVLLSRAPVLIAALDVLLFGYLVTATSIRLPYSDMYTLLVRYLQYQADGRWWTYVWAPRVQHHLVWMRLLTALDVELFSGAAYSFIVVTAIAQLVTVWLLWRAATAEGPRDLALTKGCLVVLLVLTAVAAVDCAIPILNVYPQTVVFAVLAFMLFDPGDHSPDGGRGSSSTRRIAGLAAAIGAGFGNAAALGVWPILAWLAWRARAGRVWIAAPIAVGAAFITVYVWDLPLNAQPAPDSSLSQPASIGDVVDYLVIYMGLPLTRAAALAAPGKVLGGVLLVASTAVAVWLGLLKRTSDRTARLAVALLLFSLGTAVLAAIGRVDIPDVSGVKVPVRYSVFLAPLHVGLLLAAGPVLTRLWPARRAQVAIQAAAVATAAILFVLHVGIGRAAVVTSRSMTATIRQFMRGERTPEMPRVIHHDLDQAQRDLVTIRAAGLYLHVE
jgi:hypothetical protein